MFDNVNSSYIFKNIFSLLSVITKFKFAKYNKSLQDKLQISLIDYRRFSRKFVIYEENGRGKEYNALNNTLIYEGYFLKGERSGKGKLFYENGKLKFVGEFLNGKPHGLGKEYNKEGKLNYIGNYLNGKKNGKGMEYYNFNLDEIKFKGEYFDDKRWTGIGYDETGREIILELKDGKGCSKKFWEDDYNFYEGEYLNGERHGKGKDTVKYGSITFEGEYVNGKRWTGKAHDKKGNIYFELKDGKGIKKQIYLSLIDIAQFEYEYFNGEKNGIGRGYIMKEVDKTNSEFDCRFEEKKLIKEKLIFEGEYKNNMEK